MWCLPDFSVPVQSFPSRQDAYKHLGVNLGVRSHAARVHKTLPRHSFLRCKLWNSQPACDWRGALFWDVDGKWELRAMKMESALTITRIRLQFLATGGFSSLAQRSHILQMFDTAAVQARPRQALRGYLLDPIETSESITLAQVQRLGKTTLSELCRSRVDLGEMVQWAKPFCSMPIGEHTPFFCVREIERTSAGKPKVTLVASTKSLMDRWHESSMCCIGGGYKFNIVAYPCHLIGIANSEGNIAVTAIATTSTQETDHITHMLKQYVAQIEHYTKVCQLTRHLV